MIFPFLLSTDALSSLLGPCATGGFSDIYRTGLGRLPSDALALHADGQPTATEGGMDGQV